jgi:hypothetical protein
MPDMNLTENEMLETVDDIKLVRELYSSLVNVTCCAESLIKAHEAHNTLAAQQFLSAALEYRLQLKPLIDAARALLSQEPK